MLDRRAGVMGVSIGHHSQCCRDCRQLFVDTFLIQNLTNASIDFHTPDYHPASPVLKPTEPWEGTMAFPYDGGVHWQEADNRMAMWYLCCAKASSSSGQDTRPGPTANTRSGSAPNRTKPPIFANAGLCLAFSKDGISWTKQTQDVSPGTNRVFWHGDPLPVMDKGITTSVRVCNRQLAIGLGFRCAHAHLMPSDGLCRSGWTTRPRTPHSGTSSRTATRTTTEVYPCLHRPTACTGT
eukprot:SAG22_NODE_5077_length_1091_cov_0.979839_2_plen_238_part_00